MTYAHDRTSQFLSPVGRNRRALVTPEGVPLPVEIADYGERATAFVLDLVFWLGVTAAFGVAVALIGRYQRSPAVLVSILLFIAFLVRNLYFIHFELAWRGMTPGKRIVGLRVVDRAGGPLRPVSVVARNLTRELEMFLPLGVLLSLGAAGSPGSAWEALALAVWLLLLAAVPLMNRDRMRAGDLIAGTLVIALPRRILLGDLAAGTVRHRFTDGQLRAYGAFELQILEEVLRRPAGLETDRLRRDVCDRICRKIGWAEPVPDDAVAGFLREFYTAQRAHLEREQLFGRPRADKGG